MRLERFPHRRKNKLQPWGDKPLKVLEQINDNSYRLEFPSEFNITTTFIVADLSRFNVGENSALRSNLFQEEGNDGSLPTLHQQNATETPDDLIRYITKQVLSPPVPVIP